MHKRLRLEWSAHALADRSAIFDYIEADSPQSAIAIDDLIREQVETLARFPQSGRPGRIDRTRELVISRTPYIVAYYGEYYPDLAAAARITALARRYVRRTPTVSRVRDASLEARIRKQLQATGSSSVEEVLLRLLETGSALSSCL